MLFVEAIVIALQGHGIAVERVATTGAEAIEAVRDDAPELALVDVGLPDRSGLVVGADVLEYDVPPDVTVVFLFNPFNGRVFGGALANVLRSLDAHPRPLRLIYVNPVEEEQVFATGRARLVRAVGGEGSPDEAPTSARICLYELR